jgi:hypothetical protein
MVPRWNLICEVLHPFPRFIIMLDFKLLYTAYMFKTDSLFVSFKIT